MTHYEQRLEGDENALRAAVLALADRVRGNLSNAVTALVSGDRDLAYRTILQDGPVNRETERIDALCHRFIARHLPAAGHLRFVSAVMRMVVLLERMGDYSVTICRETAQLRAPLEGAFRHEVSTMATDSLGMFEKAMRAFASRDEALARDTMRDAERVDRDFSQAFEMLLAADVSGLGMQDVFGRLIVIMQLERVSDQAKNLCEETVFAVTGETKKRRPVRVLFVSEHDDADAQIAAAIGNRRHRATGQFSSAGMVPAGTIRPDVAAFLESYGFEVGTLIPEGLARASADWSAWNVIICLDGPVDRFIDPVPFHTVVLRWDVSAEAGSIEDRYRFLSNAVAELMDTMRGPEPAA